MDVDHDEGAGRNAEAQPEKKPRTDGWKRDASIVEAGLSAHIARARPWSQRHEVHLTGVRKIPRVLNIIDMTYKKKWNDLYTSNADAGKVTKDRLIDDFLVDHSQSLLRTTSGKTWLLTPTLTTNSDYYAYQFDRRVSSKEHFRLLQHSPLNLKELTSGETSDLAGNSMHMGLVALVAIALIYSADLPIWGPTSLPSDV